MRGKTAKKLRKFVDILIKNTSEEERTKSSRQMKREVIRTYRQDPKKVRGFIIEVIAGKYDSLNENNIIP